MKTRDIIKFNLEWIFLFTGLILLAFMDPDLQRTSLCLFDLLGVFCPGEGLGRSIAYIFRGMWSEAWASHPAGYLAVPVLSGRILYILNRRNFNLFKK